MITRWAIDQAECIENTQALPQRNQYFYFAKAFGWKKPFEGGAGMVPLRRRGERSLKPSIFFLAWEKDACFWIQKPEHTVFSALSLIFPEAPPQFCLTEMEMLSLRFNFFDFIYEDGMI